MHFKYHFEEGATRVIYKCGQDYRRYENTQSSVTQPFYCETYGPGQRSGLDPLRLSHYLYSDISPFHSETLLNILLSCLLLCVAWQKDKIMQKKVSGLGPRIPSFKAVWESIQC